MDLHNPNALTPLSRKGLSVFHQTQYPLRFLILSLIFVLPLCFGFLRARNSLSQVDFYQRENYLALVILIIILKNTCFQYFSHVSHFHFSQFDTVSPLLSQRDANSRMQCGYHVVDMSTKGFYSKKGVMCRETAYQCSSFFAIRGEDINERDCLFWVHLVRLIGSCEMEEVAVSVLHVIVSGVHKEPGGD